MASSFSFFIVFSSSSLFLSRRPISQNRILFRSLSNPNLNPSAAALRWRWKSFSSSAPPPPPPPAETPPPNDSGKGVEVVLSKIQDKIRIFFAVLFWMSLFFWGSAWDKGDSSKKKGPWFKK